MKQVYKIQVLNRWKSQLIKSFHLTGEALGAIGNVESLPVLEEHCNDPVVEVAETCQLAKERIQWVLDEKRKAEIENAYKENPYCSVDPTPSIAVKDIEQLKAILLNEELPLFERYRAMFALRNKGDETSVLALAEGMLNTFNEFSTFLLMM